MADARRDFVKYTFYQVAPEWRRLPASERAAGKDEFAAVAAEYADRLALNTYSLVGARGDADFMLWGVCPRLETINELAGQLNRTRLAGYLQTPYSYLGMTRRSPYIDDHRHEGQDGAGDTAARRSAERRHEGQDGAGDAAARCGDTASGGETASLGGTASRGGTAQLGETASGGETASLRIVGRRYLFMYPFWKTHEWYQLSQEARQEMMTEHFRIGHRFPQVKISTAYSFGLDDPEFILGFETDDPGGFLDLVMALRESRARPYTLRDTPIFSCINRPLRECLDDAA